MKVYGNEGDDERSGDEGGVFITTTFIITITFITIHLHHHTPSSRWGITYIADTPALLNTVVSERNILRSATSLILATVLTKGVWVHRFKEMLLFFRLQNVSFNSISRDEKSRGAAGSRSAWSHDHWTG